MILDMRLLQIYVSLVEPEIIFDYYSLTVSKIGSAHRCYAGKTRQEWSRK